MGTAFTHAPVVTHLVTTLDEFSRLQPEWNDLHQRSGGRVATGFAWAMAAWLHDAAPAHGELRIITLRQDGILACIWPLARYRARGAAKLRQLCWDRTDYCDILAASGPSALDLARTAWQVAKGLGDLIELRYVRRDTLLDQLLQTIPNPATSDSIQTYAISFAGHPTLDSFYENAAVSIGEIGRKFRRLQRLGALEFRPVDDRSEGLRLLEWAWDQKIQWMREKNLSATSMGNPQYHAFLRHLADQIPANSPLQFFSFYLDGTPIAAMVTATSERVLESFIITNNPKFNKYSIGNVLQAHSIAWAHARGLDFDFRWGGSPQKLAWSNEITDITTYQVALTLRGAAPVAREGLRLAAVRLRSRYRRGAGWVVGRLLKPWMLPLKAWALRQAARSSADA